MNNKPDTAREKCLKEAEWLAKVAYTSSISIKESDGTPATAEKEDRMSKKVCGDCIHYDSALSYCRRAGACLYAMFGQKECPFTDAPPTNGDKIIAGGNKALVNFHLLGTCDTCIYYNKEHTNHNDICLCPKDKTCADGIEGWLNAPTGKDNNVPTKEREVSNDEMKPKLCPFCKNEIDVPKEFWAVDGVTVLDKIRTLLSKVDELTVQVDDLRDDIESIHIYYNDLFTTL